jgi:putative SOS response-associated peptidase YedK
MVPMRWGIIPFFTEDPDALKGQSMFNARADSITKANSWREPFKKRRCLVPASGFYEWVKIAKDIGKPYTFALTDGSLLAFAGIWDAWKGPDGHWLQSCYFAISWFQSAKTSAPEFQKATVRCQTEPPSLIF